MPKKQKTKAAPFNDKLKGLYHFVSATEKVVELLESRSCKPVHKASAAAFRGGGLVTNKVLELVQSGGSIDESTACLYRDTSARLGTLLSDGRAVSKLQLKAVMKLMDGLGKVAQVSSARTDLPLTLSDTVLMSTWLDFKTYVDGHGDDRLLMMQQYVKTFQSQQRRGPLKTLLEDYEEEMRSFRGRRAWSFPSF
ncbi:hypothetical protein PHYSODRAFT_327496 [Phytophthora sojae]|uniref:Uncharacterized protein n=1 Tax=Phytophthora sojae (strain P6497) TaxID=1094619 RepID=G4ZAJ8_PHYSP|nr:hypothetical protein PHYSODRAFT_327483 [Phytophthora sojae]XP_009521912.1 hypothetical protein PHYSODRAFT_327496 [Phytophthora sojae]EGZ19181.1 hypothetical protein PHYSODRAFT_327483 [Phytophthora sojae]EGZ19195.1 hypothetical protein PHYSODRAFT_327496 [Phytophthora sojae]|eukprot:XP_009521898.1 hypothetical protein PHYSODRAFT_327483 [Phytophthora sojae]